MQTHIKSQTRTLNYRVRAVLMPRSLATPYTGARVSSHVCLQPHIPPPACPSSARSLPPPHARLSPSSLPPTRLLLKRSPHRAPPPSSSQPLRLRLGQHSVSHCARCLFISPSASLHLCISHSLGWLTLGLCVSVHLRLSVPSTSLSDSAYISGTLSTPFLLSLCLAWSPSQGC